MATNPYAAPQARVDDAPGLGLDGEFVAEGQALSAGQAWQWITDGWQIFRRQPGTWIGITIALFLFYVVLGLVPLIGQLATTVLTPLIGAGLLLGCKAIDEGGTLTFGHLIEGFKLPQAGRLAVLGLAALASAIVLMVVIFAVAGAGWGFAMLGGQSGPAGFGVMALVAILLALGLSVPVYMALWFAPSLVTFQDYGAIDALKTSFFACLKNIVPFIIYGIVVTVLAILAMIPLGLGLLVLMPVIIASVYTAYRDIFFVR